MNVLTVNVLTVVEDHAGSGCVEYSFNEWIQPHNSCGPLCEFEYYEDAIEFIRQYGYGIDHKISECWYMPSNQKTIWNINGEAPSDLPRGTVLADVVYLISEVAW